MVSKKLIVFVLIAIMFSALSVSQQRSDSVNFASIWNNMSESEKNGFIVGFFAGIKFIEEIASSVPPDINFSSFSIFLDATFNCTEEESKSLLAYMSAFYSNPMNSSENLLNAFSWSWRQLRP